MACAAVLLASDQKCVREYVTHGENGLLTDFFDYEKLAQMAVEVLQDPPAYRHLGEAAARTVTDKYSLELAIPRIESFFKDVAQTPRSPSIRADLICREGTIYKSMQEDPDAEVRSVATNQGGVAKAPDEWLPEKPPEPSTPPPDVSHLPAHQGTLALLQHAESRVPACRTGYIWRTPSKVSVNSRRSASVMIHGTCAASSAARAAGSQDWCFCSASSLGA